MPDESSKDSKKKKSEKFMVIQMGQNEDHSQDQMLIDFLSKNALDIKHHPGAVQFQVSKQMLSQLRSKFTNLKTVDGQKPNGTLPNTPVKEEEIPTISKRFKASNYQNTTEESPNRHSSRKRNYYQTPNATVSKNCKFDFEMYKP